MIVILLKLLKDFRLAKSKLILMLLAACISAWGISSVVYSYMMAERDFQVNFARTLPADIEVFVENYTRDLEDKFLADKNVIDIERREAIGGRIKNLSGDWMPLILYAVDVVDNMRIDKFRVLEKDTGSQDKILIETNAAFYLNPAEDSIEVQFPEKGEIVWKKGGVAHDARLAPARMERVVYAYATSIDMVSKYLDKGRRRLLIETNVSSDKKALQDIAERLKRIAEQESLSRRPPLERRTARGYHVSRREIRSLTGFSNDSRDTRAGRVVSSTQTRSASGSAQAIVPVEPP